MKNRYKRKAWYLDEDVLIEGCADKRGFHPGYGIPCGFGLVIFTKRMIGKEIFFDLNEALRVCGDVDVASAEHVVFTEKNNQGPYTTEELLRLGKERNFIELAEPLY